MNFMKKAGNNMSADSRNEFVKIYKDNIKREGADNLLAYIETTDFFIAPASVKMHSNFEGGLCEHSINVYKRLLNLIKMEYGKNWEKTVSNESVAIIGLFHDLCKANIYKTEMRNVKVDGAWTQQPYYTVEDSLPYGHGEKSVYMLSGFLKLTREEAMAINWHMGGFDSRVRGGGYGIEEAYSRYPVALLTHVADLQASYLDEKRK
jgi:hypothetical protein